MEASISVCMAAFNGERHIAAQLESILMSASVDELLVSDDGSSDRTVDVIRSIGDSRVRLLAGPQAGLIRNYEFLIAQAAGDTIFLADQDDVWFDTKVDAMQVALRNADLVVSDCVVVNEDLQPVHPSFFALRRSRPGLFRNLVSNGYLGCCMAFNRKVVERALPFPRDVPMHDWWLGLVAEAFATVCFIEQPLMQYRRHGGNASSASERSRTSISRRLAWRASLVRHLARRHFAKPMSAQA